MLNRTGGRLLAVLIAVTASGGLASCSGVSDPLDSLTAVPASDVRPAEPILETRRWGVVDGMLSVVIDNTTQRTLRFAEAVITARTSDDQLVASSLEVPDSSQCCDVVDLPPGHQYGFYLDVGNAAEVSRVDVAYRNVAWAAPDAVSAKPTVHAKPVDIEEDGASTVVEADVTAASQVDQAVAQAFLTSPAGDLVAVVSGRWTCFEPGVHSIRMQLFHPVPEGTVVDRVQVHPVTDDPTTPDPHC